MNDSSQAALAPLLKRQGQTPQTMDSASIEGEGCGDSPNIAGEAKSDIKQGKLSIWQGANGARDENRFKLSTFD